MVALAATVCYLPLHVRHVVHVLRGARPAGFAWSLAAMAAVILVALPYVGALWLTAFHSLAVSVLILVRRPWSLVGYAGLVVAPALLAGALQPSGFAVYYSLAVAWRSLAPFVVIRLVGAIRALDDAREALAQEAVTRERLRIDGDLQRTLGVALEEIADRAVRADERVARDVPAAEAELRALVDGSRRTLAEARQLVRTFQRSSLQTEVQTAAALLEAAGIAVRVELPDGLLDDDVDVSLRSALQSATANLLSDGATRSCVIAVARDAHRVWLEFRSVETASAVTIR